MRILLVEDEGGIADFVERALRAQGHAVEVAADGVEGGSRAVGSDLDLVILDVMLPGRSGLEILEEIRAVKPALPVIMLTARAEVADKVAGLDAGATDYMTKPFSVEELLARVRAHLRTPVQAETTRLRVADIELDMLRRTVSRDGSPVHLSAKEFDLLAYFMRHPGQVLSRAADPQRRLGLRPRPGHQHRRGLRRLPAPQAGARRPARADPDRALGGLPARGRLMGLRGLRPRVTLLIVAVVVVCVGIAFAAVYAGTARELSKRSHQDLRADMAALEQVVTAGSSRPSAVTARARAYLAHQPFRPTSHVLFVVPVGGRPVSNEPELLGLSPPDEGESRAAAAPGEPGGARVPGRAARLQLPPASRRRAHRAAGAGSRALTGGRSRASASASRPRPRTAPSARCATSSCSPGRSRSWPRSRAASRSPRASRRRCAAWRGWRRASTPAISARGWMSPPATTRCACWPRPSTTCSTASRTPSTARRRSSPTPRTSCAHR